MPPLKKPRVDAEPSRATLTTLPQPLQRRVLRYVAPEDCLVQTDQCKYEIKLDELSIVSQVSKVWHAIVDELASERVLQIVYLPRTHDASQSGRRKRHRKRSELMALRRQLILRRTHTERLVVDEPPDYGTIGFQLWSAALSHAPKLKTLELATVATMDMNDRPTDRITDVVRAATRHCPALKKLTIPEELRPPRKERTPADGQYMRTLLSAVYDGLKVWSAHDDGLRYLQVPLHNITQDAEAYVDNVITHCPQIQTHVLTTAPRYYNSYGMQRISGEDAWKLDLETWDRFCRVCSQLQEFCWRNVPFATQFFEIFGNHVKPKLRSLSLVTSENWVWNDYFQVVDKATHTNVKATGFGNTARNAESVLRAAPNLEILDIKWIDAIAGDVPPAMDPDVFGDEFVEALATLCKNLKCLTYDIIPRRAPPRVTTFTDRSMRALAALPHLESVDISAVNVTGDGLFDLVTNHLAGTRHQREYKFTLGALVADTLSTEFYDVLEGFLERLANQKAELPCATRRVSLRLMNRSFKALEEGESAAYLGKIRHLAQQVRKLHPSLQLRGLVRDYDEEFGTMRCIVEFVFATERTEMPAWNEVRYTNDIVDESIDDVFVHRIYPDYGGIYVIDND